MKLRVSFQDRVDNNLQFHYSPASDILSGHKTADLKAERMTFLLV